MSQEQEILCNNGRCSIVRGVGDADHEHNIADRDFDKTLLDKVKRSSSSNLKIFYPFVIGIILFAYFLYYSSFETVDVLNDKQILLGILAASATILAISFTISQFTVSKISEVYSPIIIRYYNEGIIFKCAFFSLLLITSLSAIFSGLNSTDDFVKSSVNYMIIISFLGSLFIFAQYFFRMMDIIDPFSFSVILRDLAIRKIQKNNLEDYEAITEAMGNVAYKSLENREKRVAIRYFAELENLAKFGMMRVN